MLKPVTLNTLNQLMSKPLFSKVGEFISDLVTPVCNWDEAFRECSTYEYKALRNNARNQLSITLHENHNQLFNQTWNTYGEPIHSHINAFVTNEVNKLELNAEMTKRIITCVNWDWVLLGFECQYSDLVKPAFFTGLSYWYDQGHFPCGWDGEYPAGKLMVF